LREARAKAEVPDFLQNAEIVRTKATSLNFRRFWPPRSRALRGARANQK
jgi:hypothetical protein